MPVSLLIAAKALLALILLTAGGAKLADPAGFGTTLVRLRVPRLGGRLAGMVVGAVESVIALVSLAAPARSVDLIILGLFVVFAGANLAAALQPRRVPCNCFGPLGRGELGWVGFLRALLLAGLGTVVWSQHATMDDSWQRVGAGWVVLVGLAGIACIFAVWQVALTTAVAREAGD